MDNTDVTIKTFPTTPSTFPPVYIGGRETIRYKIENQYNKVTSENDPYYFENDKQFSFGGIVLRSVPYINSLNPSGVSPIRIFAAIPYDPASTDTGSNASNSIIMYYKTGDSEVSQPSTLFVSIMITIQNTVTDGPTTTKTYIIQALWNGTPVLDGFFTTLNDKITSFNINDTNVLIPAEAGIFFGDTIATIPTFVRSNTVTIGGRVTHFYELTNQYNSLMTLIDPYYFANDPQFSFGGIGLSSLPYINNLNPSGVSPLSLAGTDNGSLGFINYLKAGDDPATTMPSSIGVNATITLQSTNIIQGAPINVNLALFQRIKDITYGNGKYVAVGDGTDTVMYSDDANEWSRSATSCFTQAGIAVTYDGTTFIAVGKDLTFDEATDNNVCISSDGVNWSRVNSALYDSGICVATGVLGSIVTTINITDTDIANYNSQLDITSDSYFNNGFDNMTVSIKY
jgi:hypothetical protein